MNFITLKNRLEITLKNYVDFMPICPRDQILKLSNEGQDFAITAKNFKEMKIAKEILSPYEYNELFGQVQDGIRNAYLTTSETPEYKEADNEGKIALLKDVRRGVMEAMLSQTPYESRILDAIQSSKDSKQ